MPFVVGSAMATIPPVMILAGTMGVISKSGTGMSETEGNMFGGMALGGALLSPVLMPLGTLLKARQGLLVTRDIGLLYKFTSSTTRLNLQSLPSAETISKMNNHHQLLTMARHYFDKEGNIVEKSLLTIPGIKGYKTVPKI